MSKPFNEGFGKQPRINHERVPFIDSLPNTFPFQALKQDSQTCNSVTILRYTFFKHQKLTGTHCSNTPWAHTQVLLLVPSQLWSCALWCLAWDWSRIWVWASARHKDGTEVGDPGHLTSQWSLWSFSEKTPRFPSTLLPGHITGQLHF